MDFDTAIGALKSASALISAALGIAAIFSNFRTKSGKLTRGGYAVLVGICISAVVGIVTSTIETKKARSESEEQLRRNEVVLKEVSRAVQPITALEMNYWFEIPQGNPNVDAYVKRISAAISQRMDALSAFPPLADQESTKGLKPWLLDENNNVVGIGIEKESDLWPSFENDERPIATMLMLMGMSANFRRAPVEPEKYQPIHGRDDFQASSFLAKSASLNWSLKDRRLEIVVRDEIDRKFWRSSGRIRSIVDLRGAQLLLIPTGAAALPTNVPKRFHDETSSKLQSELLRNLQIRYFTITLGEGRQIRIHSSKFRKSKYVGGEPVFSITFPEDEEKFARLFEEADREVK